MLLKRSRRLDWKLCVERKRARILWPAGILALTYLLFGASTVTSTMAEIVQISGEVKGQDLKMVGGILRIKFSELVEPETLRILHRSGMTDAIPVHLRELIDSACGASLKSVYQVSEDDIRDDKYGFARDFELRLKDSADEKAAMEVLRSSPLIKKVSKVTLRRSFD